MASFLDTDMWRVSIHLIQSFHYTRREKRLRVNKLDVYGMSISLVKGAPACRTFWSWFREKSSYASCAKSMTCNKSKDKSDIGRASGIDR